MKIALEIKRSQQSYKSLEAIIYNIEELNSKPSSLLGLIPQSVPVTPNITQPITTTPLTFSQAFAQARKNGLTVFEYKGKKYGTQLKGETKTAGEGVVAETKTKKGDVSKSNDQIDDDAPVTTVNLPGVEVVAKRYVHRVGGKEYAFSSEEKKNAFVDKVNRLITNSLTAKKYGYNPKKNWYRTKIG